MASRQQWPASDEPRGHAAVDGHLSRARAQLDRAAGRALPAHDVSQRPRAHGDVSDLRLIRSCRGLAPLYRIRLISSHTVVPPWGPACAGTTAGRSAGLRIAAPASRPGSYVSRWAANAKTPPAAAASAMAP